MGREENRPDSAGVDIILPALPWVENAVRRAQENPVDFGFGPVPALTLEDVLISKLWALKGTKLRAKDLDDLQSVLAANHAIDMAYLSGEMRRLGIVVPKAAEPFLPDLILKISRDIARGGEETVFQSE